MIVTLTPNPSLDRTLFLDTFTRGAVNRCTATLAEPSGKGINVALALHRHGVPVLAVLPIGGPAGQQLVQLLDTAGLPYRAVTITGTIRTNVSIVEAEGTSSKINESGPTLTSEEVEELVRTTRFVQFCRLAGDLWNSAERVLRTPHGRSGSRSAHRRSTGSAGYLRIDAPGSAHRHTALGETKCARVG
jgi:sugar/nucleoside kinase (ribokinase family)